MFSKLTIQERYYIFVSICLIWMVSYQCYHNYQTDVLIHESIEQGNKRVLRYYEINNKLRLENEGLKHDLIHEQAMYTASKGHVESLEEQIDLISEHWKKQFIKVSDELFDLKHKEK